MKGGKNQTLILVEGAKTERIFYERLNKAFLGNYQFNIFTFKCNIYALYQFLQKYKFDIEVPQALIESPNLITENERKVLQSTKFTRIFLVFDMDIKENGFNYEEKKRRLKKLQRLFNNETEYGLLLINYPMFESIRERINGDLYFKPFSVESYKDVIDKRGEKIDLSKCDYTQILSLINNSICLTNRLLTGSTSRPKYKDIKNTWGKATILNKEIKLLDEEGKLFCLNTSCQLPLICIGDKLYKKL